MDDATANWLRPMMVEALDVLEDGEYLQMMINMSETATPLPEDHPLAGIVADLPEDVHVSAIDWIYVGQWLRDRLGWDECPEWPSD